MSIFAKKINPAYFLVSIIISISFLPNYCFCIRTGNWNYSTAVSDSFSVGVATWYGDPNGAGSDGGACGYRYDVEKPPFSAMISAGNANLFKSGMDCGSCYEVRCTQNSACSGEPVMVSITDECNCDAGNVHFDLSGTAFGALAKPGQADTLRGAGTFNIDYRRVPCNYQQSIVFNVDSGSNPYNFACVIEYMRRDGDLSKVELKNSNSDWLPMQHSWGAIWQINLPSGLDGPFSIMLTKLESQKVIVAENVIPSYWQPGKSYESNVNFD